MPTLLNSVDGEPDIMVGCFPVLVGRHPRCDTKLVSSRVSRRHCALVEVDGSVMVRDLGSTNGTRINGHRIDTGWLRPGDVFEVANVRYRVVDGGGEPTERGAGRADDPGNGTIPGLPGL
jgi:pSer/pThr/pTyr-binding forkhead associated (FHA) protein